MYAYIKLLSGKGSRGYGLPTTLLINRLRRQRLRNVFPFRPFLITNFPFLFLSTGVQSVIEEAMYSGILLPGNEWKALSYLGRTARMAYRVRVRCERNYYGQTCTKLCKPRDDRFGHYTCGDTDGRKECIPGWQGENCDIGEIKTKETDHFPGLYIFDGISSQTIADPGRYCYYLVGGTIFERLFSIGK